jgi:hypothetical protein
LITIMWPSPSPWVPSCSTLDRNQPISKTKLVLSRGGGACPRPFVVAYLLVCLFGQKISLKERISLHKVWRYSWDCWCRSDARKTSPP